MNFLDQAPKAASQARVALGQLGDWRSQHPCSRWFPRTGRTGSPPQVEVATMQKVLRFLRSEDGPTAVEYAVMLGLVVCVCLGTIGMLGNTANNKFNDIVTNLSGSAPGG